MSAFLRDDVDMTRPQLIDELIELVAFEATEVLRIFDAIQ
jgi:predicted RNA-binding protein with PIN domain